MDNERFWFMVAEVHKNAMFLLFVLDALRFLSLI